MTSGRFDAAPAAIFDLDGTLVDTAADLIVTLNHVLAAEGLEAIDPTLVRPMIGRGAKGMIERAFDHHGLDQDAERIERLHVDFLAHYEDHMADHSRPFEGVVACLDTLAASGITLGVCTNKYERYSRRLLEDLDMARHFKVIVGPDTLDPDGTVRKPDPAHLLGTLERIGGTPERAVMVGDSILDVQTAKAAGVPVVAVTFGYSEMPPAAFGADVLADHYREVTPEILRLLRPAIA